MANTPTGGDYDLGFEAGLIQGYRSAREGSAGFAAYSESVDRRRKFLAWSTLLLGLGSAIGALVIRRDKDMYTALAVSGGVVTAIVGAAQVLADETAPGAFGLRVR